MHWFGFVNHLGDFGLCCQLIGRGNIKNKSQKSLDHSGTAISSFGTVLFKILKRTGGQEDRRTGGQENRRIGGLEDWRTGGQEDWRTGGQEDWRTGGLEDRRTGGLEEDFRPAYHLLSSPEVFEAEEFFFFFVFFCSILDWVGLRPAHYLQVTVR